MNFPYYFGGHDGEDDDGRVFGYDDIDDGHVFGGHDGDEDDGDRVFGYDDIDDDSGDEWDRELKRATLLPSFKDRERLGGGVIGCWSTGIDGKPLKLQTPLGRFCLRVDAIARNIGEMCTFSVPENDIQILLAKSQELPRVEYKNPTAFVLGYLATRGGTRDINKRSLAQTWNCYRKTNADKKDESIREPDIIRYARLWITSRT